MSGNSPPTFLTVLFNLNNWDDDDDDGDDDLCYSSLRALYVPHREQRALPTWFHFFLLKTPPWCCLFLQVWNWVQGVKLSKVTQLGCSKVGFSLIHWVDLYRIDWAPTMCHTLCRALETSQEDRYGSCPQTPMRQTGDKKTDKQARK